MEIGEKSIYEQLEAEAREVGAKLHEICEDIGLCASTVQKWKHDEPKTVKTIRLIRKEILNKKNNS